MKQRLFLTVVLGLLAWGSLASCGCGVLLEPVAFDPESWRLRWSAEQVQLERFTRAWEYFRDGQAELAYREFRRVSFALPDLRDHALFLSAQAASRLGRHSDQRQMLRALAERYPESVWFPDSAVELGRFALERGDLGQARHWAIRALSVNPQQDIEDAARLLLAKAAEREGRLTDAAGEYRTLWRLRRSKVSREAKRALMDLRARDPSLLPSSIALLEEARWAIAERDWELARKLAEQVLRLGNPEEAAAAVIVIAEAGFAQGDRAEAWRLLWGVAENRPESPHAPTALLRLASLLWNADRETAAERVFEELARRYPTTEEGMRAVLARARIALNKGDPERAARLLSSLDRFPVPQHLVRDVSWLVAWAAWHRGNFARAARAFAALGKNDPAGLYWQARAKEAAGRRESARRLYARVEAMDPGYYGLQAQRRRQGLGAVPLHPAVAHVPSPPGFQIPPSLPGAPFFHERRWRLLLSAGLKPLAHRELRAILPSVRAETPEEQGAILDALEASDAFREAVAKARVWRALQADRRNRALYPLAYWEIVRAAASEFALDPLLVLAVMRQESLYDPQAESSAGARGLMQMMPATAEQVAATLGVDAPLERIEQPEINVRLGARHLRSLLDRYGNDLVKTLAAYNAGEAAVERWTARFQHVEPDEFVELIGYRETREYVKQVLSHYTAYQRLYALPGVAFLTRTEPFA